MISLGIQEMNKKKKRHKEMDLVIFVVVCFLVFDSDYLEFEFDSQFIQQEVGLVSGCWKIIRVYG